MSRLEQLKHIKRVAQDPAHSQHVVNTRCSTIKVSPQGLGRPGQAGKGQRHVQGGKLTGAGAVKSSRPFEAR